MKKVMVTFSLMLALLFTGFVVYPELYPVSADEIPKGTAVVDVPEGVNYVSDIKAMSDGELVLIGGNQHDKTLNQYVSYDEGATWKQQNEYLEKLPIDMRDVEAVESFGYLSDDGYVAISVCTYETYLTHSNGETDEESGAKLSAFIINPNGAVIEVSQPQTAEYGGFVNAYFAGDKLYWSDVRGNLYDVDRDTGKVLDRIQESGYFYSATVAADSETLQIVEDAALGHAFENPFPDEDVNADEILTYSSAAEGTEGGAYVVDLDGIHLYSEKAGKQTIWENTRDDFNKYSDFYDMTALDDETFFVVMFNEKVGDEQLIKMKLEE